MAEATGERTAEQHEAVRRRALPVALSSVAVGAIGLGMLLGRTITEGRPPALFGVNLSFCAMLMGAGILFYARRTPGTKAAQIASGIAIMLGIAGPMVFAQQSVHWRKAMEQRELSNVAAIANAAMAYAKDHGGAYPDDVLVLLEQNRLTPEQVHSPFGNEEAMQKRRQAKSPEDFEKWYASHCDYVYMGQGLILKVHAGSQLTTTAPSELPMSIVVVRGTDPIMRKLMSFGYVDGRAAFLTSEQAEEAMKSSNAERARLGFAVVPIPQSVRQK